jgi:hypothetical protein
MTANTGQANVRRRRRDSLGSDDSHTSNNLLLATVKNVECKVEDTLLWAWDELPDWRRDNAFIHTGYRPTSNNYRLSFGSIFSIHSTRTMSTTAPGTAPLGVKLPSLFFNTDLYKKSPMERFVAKLLTSGR